MLIAVSDAVSSFPIHLTNDLELVLVEVQTCSKKLILGVCYRSPSCSPALAEELHDVTHMITVRYPNSSFILLGDFNFPNIVWSDMHSWFHPLFFSESDRYFNLCNDSNLSQLVMQASRITSTTSNVLDLVLTTTPDLFRKSNYKK